MHLFLKKLTWFSFFVFVLSELTIRIFHLSTDAPRTYKNENGNVNFYPNQEGYWDGGRHKWYINAMGYPGRDLPESFNDLVFIIGDSYIQNFMNPDSCRQMVFLNDHIPDKNFMELSMAGLNLLGYFEYSKPLDSLNPNLKLVYVHNGDFIGNVSEINSRNTGYKVDLITGNLFYPEYRGSKIKDFIYNFKFLYYLYRKNLKLISPEEVEDDPEKVNKKQLNIDYKILNDLLDFIKNNYKTKNVVLVFHPNSDKNLINFVKQKGFNAMEILKPKNENWKTDKDGHWNCHAHSVIAKQVAEYVKNLENSMIYYD